MDEKSISGQAEQYVRDYFDLHQDGKLLYHNLYHTEKVVRAATQIGQHYKFGDTDLFIVITAAWFHDIGYLSGGAPGHEERGARMLTAFLQGKGVEASAIERIRQCILATQLPQRAVSLDEQIVCDADLFHLGTDEFGERNKLLRKEAEAVKGAKINKEEWRKSTIRLLEGHQYYTDYCRNLLDGKQRENLEEEREKEEKHGEGHGGHEGHEKHGGHENHEGQRGHGEKHGAAHGGRDRNAESPEGERGWKADAHGVEKVGQGGGGIGGKATAGAAEGGIIESVKSGGGIEKSAGGTEKSAGGTEKKPGGTIKSAGVTDKLENLLHRHLEEVDQEESRPAEQAGKKAKKKDPGRSIDTVFRISSNNNQRLSSQADSKAHILIQVNAIIISVLLSLLLRRIEDHTNLAIPAILLLTVNLVTIIFSILATRPQIPPGRFTRADLEEKRVNLLFFGNFYRMSLEEYAGGMLQMMEDRDFLYGSLIRDVYFQGIALGRKYRWLRWSYNVFMYGLIVSVTAFVVAALAFPVK